MLTPIRDVAGIRLLMPPQPGVITSLHVPPEPLPGEVRRQLPALPRTIAGITSSPDRLEFVVATAADEASLQAAFDGFVPACRFEYD